MKINTRDFGPMELNENELLSFRCPIFGYEELSRFALLANDATDDGISWLQSVENPDVCFVLLDPDALGLPYCPSLPSDTTLQLGETGPIAFRLIAVVPENFQDTTVNMKSPIVINTEKRLAGQVILEEDYPIRMRLFDAQEGA